MKNEQNVDLLNEINSIFAKQKTEKKVVKKEILEPEEPVERKNLPELRNFLSNRSVLNNVTVVYGKFETRIRIE
jgi:hypothetical protein